MPKSGQIIPKKGQKPEERQELKIAQAHRESLEHQISTLLVRLWVHKNKDSINLSSGMFALQYL